MERHSIRENFGKSGDLKVTGKYKGRKEGSITLHGKLLEEFVYLYKLGMNKSRLAGRYSVTRATIYRWIDTLIKKEVVV